MAFIFKKKGLTAKENEKKIIRPAGAWSNYSKARRTEKETSFAGKKELISVKELSLSYDGHRVLNDLSFSLCCGDYLCIIGDNGTGKTTLMDALLGLKKPDCGEIKYASDISKTQIGFLPQRTELQSDFPASVSEIVMSGCIGRRKNSVFFSKNDRQIAFDNMEKLGITHLSSRSYRELSGGQQQRVLLARALCSAQRILMLDEPISGLDPKATLDMYSLVGDINKREGISIIMISHDMPAVLKYATHILYLGKGGHFFGKTDEFVKEYPQLTGNKDLQVPDYGESGAYKFGYSPKEEST